MRTMLLLVLSAVVMTGLVVGVLVTAGVLRSPLETVGALGLPIASPAPAAPTPVPLPPAPRKGEVAVMATPVTAVGRLAPELPAGSPLEPARALYGQICARCHGDAGDRIQNVNLASIDFLDERGEHKLRQSLAQGRGIMPAQAFDFEGPLSSEELTGLYEYVRFLAGARPSGGVMVASSPPGVAASPIRAAPGSQALGAPAPDEISHSIWGWEDRCLACHSRDGIKPVQVSHAGRPNRTCLYCHWVSPELPQAMALSPQTQGRGDTPEIPHATRAAVACDSCHSERGYRALSAEHKGYEGLMMCADCHYPAASLANPAATTAGAR